MLDQMSHYQRFIIYVVETAGMEESRLKPADLKACTYDQEPITFDGQMDLHISF